MKTGGQQILHQTATGYLSGSVPSKWQEEIMNDLATKGAHMNLFKSFTLKWWQTGLFKWGMLALGIAIGTYWHDFFGDYLPILTIAAFVSLTYVTFVWWKQ